jgi:hypothetical protein
MNLARCARVVHATCETPCNTVPDVFLENRESLAPDLRAQAAHVNMLFAQLMNAVDSPARAST